MLYVIKALLLRRQRYLNEKVVSVGRGESSTGTSGFWMHHSRIRGSRHLRFSNAGKANSLPLRGNISLEMNPPNMLPPVLFGGKCAIAMLAGLVLEALVATEVITQPVLASK